MTAVLVVCWALCVGTIGLNVRGDRQRRRRADPATVARRVDAAVIRSLTCTLGVLATVTRNDFLVGLFAYFAAFPWLLGAFLVLRVARQRRAAARHAVQ